MDSLMKQPLSTNPKIAILQDGIRRINIEKAQLGLRQTEATQAGNVAEAARLAQQIKELQLQIPPKTQEIRLLELQSKTLR